MRNCTFWVYIISMIWYYLLGSGITVRDTADCQPDLSVQLINDAA